MASTLACPYGGIYFETKKKKGTKCDRCDAETRCVKACEHEVLSLVRSRRLLDYLHADDQLTPGAMLCTGCPAELAYRFALRVLGEDVILFGTPGCAAPIVSGMQTKACTRLPAYFCLFTNVASSYCPGVGPRHEVNYSVLISQR